MAHSIDRFLTAGTDETAIARLVVEMNAADCDELMEHIDMVMESNDSNGPMLTLIASRSSG